MTNIRSHPLVILGAGYTSRFLYPLAQAQGWQTYATSRSPSTHLTHIDPADRIEFDLLREGTWNNIPSDAHLIWCFPAIPEEAANDFVQQQRTGRGRLLILGSTSAYGKDHDDPVNEETTLDLSLPRVRSEEHLRKACGAMILRLAGLYGPHRHVLNWIRSGKVKNTDRYVNLAHIEDVAEICLAALEHSPDGEVYIVSDGLPRQWSEIFQEATRRWGLPHSPLVETSDSGKRLNIQKLQSTFQHSFRYPNLYEALDSIEKARQDSP